MQNQSVDTATAVTVASLVRDSAPFEPERTPFGEPSNLFQPIAWKQPITMTETLLLELFREAAASEHDPIAYSDFEVWAWLKMEAGGVLRGH